MFGLLTVNQRVAGSSPAGGATQKARRNASGFLFSYYPNTSINSARYIIMFAGRRFNNLATQTLSKDDF